MKQKKSIYESYKTRRSSIALALLILFGSYIGQVLLFSHTHIVNGGTIVHSHYYDSHHSTKDAGGHSESELTLIASLNSLQTEAITPNIDFATTDWQQTDEIITPITHLLLQDHTSNQSSRAPPAA